jgi:hypothetical protein
VLGLVAEAAGHAAATGFDEICLIPQVWPTPWPRAR